MNIPNLVRAANSNLVRMANSNPVRMGIGIGAALAGASTAGTLKDGSSSNDWLAPVGLVVTLGGVALAAFAGLKMDAAIAQGARTAVAKITTDDVRQGANSIATSIGHGVTADDITHNADRIARAINPPVTSAMKWVSIGGIGVIVADAIGAIPISNALAGDGSDKPAGTTQRIAKDFVDQSGQLLAHPLSETTVKQIADSHDRDDQHGARAGDGILTIKDQTAFWNDALRLQAAQN